MSWHTFTSAVPMSWGALYTRFDHWSDMSVAPVLQELRDCGPIKVTNHKNVMVAAITQSGLNRLR